MKAPQSVEGHEAVSSDSRSVDREQDKDRKRKPSSLSRLILGAISVAVLALIFGRDLVALITHALANDLHSHIVLIPWITAYLIYVYRGRLPKDFTPSWGFGLFAAISGGVAFMISRHLRNAAPPISENDYLSLMALSLILFVVAAGFLFLGRRWMWAAAFPVAFLIFAIPLPDGLVELLENGSKIASAEVANAFFLLTNTPMVRDGAIFQLPGIVIEVAQECSGIRSSWVLLITSLLASYMFLNSPWRRTILVLLVIPLGFLRNGFRILVISLLCVHVGPDMINSIIHRRGGPVFFVLSLVPLFLLLRWLRKGDTRSIDQAHPQEEDHVRTAL